MKKIEDILKDFGNVRLTEVERASMRSALDTHIRSNPCRTGVPSPYVFHFDFFFRRHLIAMSFILVFMITGSGALFAEQALPGDALYGLKRGLNEEVRGWFADSPEARAMWQLSLAERRLTEIEALSAKNELSDDVRIKLSAEVDTHTSVALGDENPPLDELPEGNLGDLAIDEEPTDPESPEATLMRASSTDPLSGGESTATDEQVFSADNIELLENDIAREMAILEKVKGERNHQFFIRTKGHLLIAEKILFESSEALKEEDLALAEELFDSAYTTFSLVATPSGEEAEVLMETGEGDALPEEDAPVSEEGAVVSEEDSTISEATEATSLEATTTAELE